MTDEIALALTRVENAHPVDEVDIADGVFVPGESYLR